MRKRHEMGARCGVDQPSWRAPACTLMAMSADFESVHNHHEQAVFAAIRRALPDYPFASHNDLLPDVACVALNRLAPRYIRHQADMSFFLSERERADDARAVDDAVRFAFEFVQARHAMKARG